ncbi:MAG: shikimate dehydrogenase [Armatimonadetes bacterium]|nr:shikimate dehydrogenase [Armatimonadota bacterium]
MKISGTTQIVGVFGFPVRHTLSPEMHNAAFEAMGLNFCYVPFEVPPDRLPAALEGVRALGLVGVNVTIPHKQAVIPGLDEITARASLIGAVNTVHHTQGRLVGDNTDAEGFLKPLQALLGSLKGKRAVLIGAGGAARAVAFSLAAEGASVWIANKTPERARVLAEDIIGAFNVERAWAASLTETAALQEILTSADIVINATSVGMYPHHQSPPAIPPEMLRSGQVVYDLVYNPVETAILRAARARGCATIDGLEMFVWQGAIAFERWTGRAAPVDVMRKTVAARLRP